MFTVLVVGAADVVGPEACFDPPQLAATIASITEASAATPTVVVRTAVP